MRFNSDNEPYGPIRLNTSLAAPAGKQRNISNFLLSCLVLIVALTSAGVPSLAIAQVPAVPTAKIGVLNYRGFTADVSELNSLPNGAEILAALRRQIDICVEAGLASDKIAFMQSVPLAINRR